MTVTPDDSARYQRMGIMFLKNLTMFSTLTLLHGNDATICPVDTQLEPIHLRHIHNGILHRSTHHPVCPVYTADFTEGLTSAVTVYRRRGLKSRPTLAIFVLIIISFTIATMYWAAWMAGFVIQIRSLLVKNVGMELTEKIVLSNVATEKPEVVQQLSASFLVS